MLFLLTRGLGNSSSTAPTLDSFNFSTAATYVDTNPIPLPLISTLSIATPRPSPASPCLPLPPRNVRPPHVGVLYP